MNTATEIKRLDWEGDARVYRLSKPLEGYSHVIVSAVIVSLHDNPIEGFLGGSGGPQTYIFGCNEEGGEVDYGELEGSFKGGLDHLRALREAGYESVLVKGR